MKGSELVTLIAAVLAALAAAATLWLQARREIILSRSHPFPFPALMRIRPVEEEPSITIERRPDDDDDVAYLLGEIINWGTGLMHHVTAKGRNCEIFAIDQNRAHPFSSMHKLDQGDRLPVLLRLKKSERELAWIVTMWNTPSRQAGSFLAWCPVPGETGPLLQQFEESVRRPRLSRWWRLVPRRWRPVRLIGPGQHHLMYVTRRATRRCYQAGQELDERYAPLQSSARGT